MYVLKGNYERLKNGADVIAHKFKLNNVHDYEFIDINLITHKEIGFNCFRIKLIE